MKKWIAIGVGSAAVAGLLIWKAPSLGSDDPVVACEGVCGNCDDLDSSRTKVDSKGGWDDLNLTETPYQELEISVTVYNQLDPPDRPGKCGKPNLGEYNTKEGWVTTGAIALGWWPKGEGQYGNCDDCIHCDAGSGMAMDQNNRELCFKITNKQSENIFVKIMDSCGGNCIGTDGTCGTTQDCAALELTEGAGYNIDTRCSRAQLKADYWGVIDDPCRTSKPGIWRDWCAGARGDGLHIDIGDSGSGSVFFDKWLQGSSQWSVRAIRVDCADVPQK